MKKSLVIALALMLVLAFASSAMAAQLMYNVDSTTTTYTYNGIKSVSGEENMNYYLPTTVVGTTYAGSLSRLIAANKFTADGTTNYPYEIYLPNEEDPGDYRIHSSYAKNTDACASCHATHTAVGNYLLQWYSAYDTCMACHDGTVTTTYNVLDGRVGADADSATPGGMFGMGGGSESKHNVSGALDIAAAPGGSLVKDTHGEWETEFGCESCHSPHGNGGNARLLEPNPNKYATSLALANGISFGYYNGTTFLVKKDGAAMNPQPTGLLAATEGIISSPVYINNIFNNATVNGKTYFIAKPATLRDSLTDAVGAGYTFLKPGRESYFAISVDGVVSWSSKTYGPTNWIIDNSTGITRAIYTGDNADVAGKTIRFFGIPTVKVTMDIDNYLNNGVADPDAANKEAVFHGSGMNVFCGACHLDYNTASKEVYDLRADGKIGGAYKYDTGVYSKAHRHTVGTLRTVTETTDVLDYEWAAGKTSWNTRLSAGTQGTFTCLTCHVAHGVSKDYWNRLLVAGGKVGPSGDAWTEGELEELSGSSVLKRMPNMGTCETCHNKEAAQDGYVANSSIGATIQASVTDDITDALLDIDRTWTVTGGVRSLSFDSSSIYVGSDACQPCHKEFYAGFKETYHANLMFPVADVNAELGIANTDATYDNSTNAALVAKVAEIKAKMDAGTAEPIERAAYGWYMTFSDQYSAYTDLVGSDGAGRVYFRGGSVAASGGLYGLDDVAYIIGSKMKTRVIIRDIRPANASQLWVVEGLNGQYDLLNGGWADYNSKSNLYMNGDGTTRALVNADHGADNAKISQYKSTELQNFTENSYNFNYVSPKTDATTGAGATPGAFYVGKDWNQHCGSCHGVLTNASGTAVGSVNVSCENCHGAGANHIKAPSSKNIVNPSTKLNTVQQTQLCGSCHYRGFNMKYAYGVADDSYTDDEYLAARTMEIPTAMVAADIGGRDDGSIGFTPVALTKGYVLADFTYVTTPAFDPLNKKGYEFWTTGDNAKAEQQYPTFLGSKMYASRVVSCSTCHASHSQNAEGLALKAEGPAICAGCHDSARAIDEYLPKLGASERPYDERSHTFFGTEVSTLQPFHTAKADGKLQATNGPASPAIKAWGWGSPAEKE